MHHANESVNLKLPGHQVKDILVEWISSIKIDLLSEFIILTSFVQKKSVHIVSSKNFGFLDRTDARNSLMSSPLLIARTALCSIILCLLCSHSSRMFPSAAYAVGDSEREGAHYTSLLFPSLYGEVFEALGRSYVEPSLDMVIWSIMFRFLIAASYISLQSCLSILI